MTCIKCGRKLKDTQTFCQECLAQAELDPVDPATPIVFFAQKQTSAAKKRRAHKRVQRSPEEQALRYRAIIGRLAFVLTLALLALGVAIAALLQMMNVF